MFVGECQHGRLVAGAPPIEQVPPIVVQVRAEGLRCVGTFGELVGEQPRVGEHFDGYRGWIDHRARHEVIERHQGVLRIAYNVNVAAALVDVGVFQMSFESAR